MVCCDMHLVCVQLLVGVLVASNAEHHNHHHHQQQYWKHRIEYKGVLHIDIQCGMIAIQYLNYKCQHF